MRKILMLVLLTSCSTIQSSVPLEDRTYDISPKLDGFVYGRAVCTKKFLGFCRKKEIISEKIEVTFKNKEQAAQLFNSNFVLIQRKKAVVK